MRTYEDLSEPEKTMAWTFADKTLDNLLKGRRVSATVRESFAQVLVLESGYDDYGYPEYV